MDMPWLLQLCVLERAENILFLFRSLTPWGATNQPDRENESHLEISTTESDSMTG